MTIACHSDRYWLVASWFAPICLHPSAVSLAAELQAIFFTVITIWCRHRNNTACTQKCTTCCGHGCTKTVTQQETTLFITQLCFFRTNVMSMVLPCTKLREGAMAVLSLNPQACAGFMAKSCNSSPLCQEECSAQGRALNWKRQSM